MPEPESKSILGFGKKRYTYVIVCSDGGSYELATKTVIDADGLIQANYDGRVPKTLHDLLRDGWTPEAEVTVSTAGGGDAKHMRGHAMVRLVKT